MGMEFIAQILTPHLCTLPVDIVLNNPLLSSDRLLINHVYQELKEHNVTDCEIIHGNQPVT